MKDTEFGLIPKYRDLEFYKKNPIVKFDTTYQKASYKVFAIFIIDTQKMEPDVLEFRQPDYSSGDEFMELIKQVKRRSIINCPVDIKPDDKILTLYTCYYEIPDSRFIVMARQLRQYETPVVDVGLAVKNPAPLYPDRWYKKFGGKKPKFDDTATTTKS